MTGGLVGAVLAPKIQGRIPFRQLMIALTLIATVLFTVAALVLPSPLVAIPVAVTLVGSPAANAALFAAMLRTTPANIRGRVNNTVLMAATGFAALSPLTAGLIVQHLSGQWALGAFASAIAVAAIMCIALPWLPGAEADIASDTGAGG